MVFPRCPECAPLGPDLTHLEIRHLSSHVLSLRAIFEASPSLHTLTIYKLGRRFVQEPGFRSIVANSLHTLNVTIGYDENDHERKFFSGETCGCPLTYLVTPNLINLAVKLRFGFFCLSKHFRKLPKLEKLKISGLNLDRRDVRWIQKLSTLTHIELVRTDHTGLWDNYKAGSSSDPWRNLTSVTMSSLCGRAEMVKAICRSYTQSPRTITFNIVGRKQEDLEELQSELPNAVFNFIAPETDPFICHDIPHTDYEDIDLWSEGSEDDSSDAETNP
ncbi:hypothetical protein C0992_011968 [Termitomyces sp. T32_za158]|nr:hypothetical protein C0992_011968 [Termitomyces sp. T32_za158]